MKMTTLSYALFVFIASPCISLAAKSSGVATLNSSLRPVLDKHCFTCHNEKKKKGKVRLDNLSFKLNDLATAERWQAVLDVINAGDMPPEDEEQFPKEVKTNLLDDLSNIMVEARKNFLDKGGEITMSRLNARQYQNTLRELLGIEMSVHELPSDFSANGFDTVGVNLFMSSHQIKTYRRLGEQALEESFKWFANRHLEQSFRFEPEDNHHLMEETIKYHQVGEENSKKWIAAAKAFINNPKNAKLVEKFRKKAKSDKDLLHYWKKIPGIPSPATYKVHSGGFGYAANAIQHANWSRSYHRPYMLYLLKLPNRENGSWLSIDARWRGDNTGNYYCINLPYEWDNTYPGEYKVRIKMGYAKDAPPERRFIEFGINTREKILLGTYKVTGTIENPDILEIPITLSKETIKAYKKSISKYTNTRNHELYIRERGDRDPRNFFGQEKKKNGIGPTAAIWVDWMEIERIPATKEALPSGLEALQDVLTKKEPNEFDIRNALTQFSKVAFRNGHVNEDYISGLLKIYQTRCKAGAEHLDALKHTLAIVLSSSPFLYRNEPKKEDHKKRKLQANELAIRLAYFLWGTLPDRELKAQANGGNLLKPETLTAETERMMNDPRFVHFTTPFTDQWLGLDRFELFEADKKKYPDFDVSVKHSARQEIYETVSYLFKHNQPLTDLLKSNYVIVDPVMAHYYQLEGEIKNGFQKITLPANSPRGGLLGMAGVHFMGGDGIHSSPVERGVWVLRKILNDPPPPAPANVPQFERLSAKLLTKRERVKMHQTDSQCASCHRKIDPIGFGLENFNAVGIWRDENTHRVINANAKDKRKKVQTTAWKIDSSGKFHKGPAFNNFFEMRDLIYNKQDDFSYGFIESLLEYSLGRNVGFSDELLIQDILKSAKANNHHIRSYIHAIVQNEVFQTK